MKTLESILASDFFYYEAPSPRAKDVRSLGDLAGLLSTGPRLLGHLGSLGVGAGRMCTRIPRNPTNLHGRLSDFAYCNGECHV